jgi:hypothetical protein
MIICLVSGKVGAQWDSAAAGRGHQLPFERFERYCPYGTPEDIAAFLVPCVEAGCTAFNLIPRSADQDALIDGAAAVKKLLAQI